MLGRLEWIRPSDRNSVRPETLPRTLAHLKRERSRRRSESKCSYGREAEARVNNKGSEPPGGSRTDETVAGSTKRLVSRSYQLKAGHCLTGQNLS